MNPTKTQLLVSACATFSASVMLYLYSLLLTTLFAVVPTVFAAFFLYVSVETLLQIMMKPKE